MNFQTSQVVKLPWATRLAGQATLLSAGGRRKKKRVLEKCCKETARDYFEEWAWNHPGPVFHLVLFLLRMRFYAHRLKKALLAWQ